MTGDITCSAHGQESHQGGDLARFPHPRHRRAGTDLRVISFILEDRLRERRADVPRRHGVDTDAIRRPFTRQAARHLRHGGLARSVRDAGADGGQARDAADVDDRAASGSSGVLRSSTFQQRVSEAAQLEGTNEITGQQGLDFVGSVSERLLTDVAARIVDQDVQSTVEVSGYGVDGGLTPGGSGHVSDQSFDELVFCLPSGQSLSEVLCATRNDEHLGTQQEQLFRHRTTNALRGTSDQRFFTCQRPATVVFHGGTYSFRRRVRVFLLHETLQVRKDSPNATAPTKQGTRRHSIKIEQSPPQTLRTLMEDITRRDLIKKAAVFSGALFLSSAASRADQQGTQSSQHGAEGSSNPSTQSNGGHKAGSLGPTDPPLDAENTDSVVPPPTDHGNVDPFKYPFSFAHKKISEAGWARQVTIEDLKMARDLAGVNMRLLPNAAREMHWHESGEWSYMLAGKARVTCMDYEGKAFVDDIGPGDLWFFPSGVPHSIQGHPDTDGCEFLLVFDDGHFSEYETFLISEWVARTPKDVLAKNMNVSESALAHIPKEEQYIFFAQPFKPIEEERKQAAGKAGYSSTKFTYHLDEAKPKVQNKHGEVFIIDSKVFPISNTVASALVTVKPGGIREMHWHPNADEWQYYIKGKGRMAVYAAGNRARTMDVQAGDVGYVPITQGHYIENTGEEDLVFLEMFKSSYYADFSFNDWITHTPETLVKSHLYIDQATLDCVPKEKNTIIPA